MSSIGIELINILGLLHARQPINGEQWVDEMVEC